MNHRAVVGFILIFVLMLSAPRPAHAACRWAWSSALGYGGAGVASYFLTEANWYAFSPRLILSGAGGTAAGAVLGSNACRTLTRNEELGSLHKQAIRLGTVLAGGTAGAIVAGFVTAGAGEPGSDEATLARSIAIGAVAGALLQYAIDRELAPVSSMSVGFGDGTVLVGGKIRF